MALAPIEISERFHFIQNCLCRVLPTKPERFEYFRINPAALWMPTRKINVSSQNKYLSAMQIFIPTREQNSYEMQTPSLRAIQVKYWKVDSSNDYCIAANYTQLSSSKLLETVNSYYFPLLLYRQEIIPHWRWNEKHSNIVYIKVPRVGKCVLMWRSNRDSRN